ncbi:membrane-bound ClpP family serine protease [Bradyrhizobium sp. USDA 4011]
MQNVIELLPMAPPSIDQLSRIIATVAAPAFLLGAVAAFISVLVSRINRVIDRSQYLHSIVDGDKAYLKADIPRLKRRSALLHRSLLCSIISAILTALIIIVAFVSAMFSFAHEYGVAILFVAALLLFCLSLIDLAREARLALHDNDLHV